MPREIHFRLVGPLEVVDHVGQNLTPTSAKAKAILVLLLLAPKMTRTRSFLLSTLWSNRPVEQAGGSLRQALMSMRKLFQDHSDVLIIDRSKVALNPTLVTCDLIDGIDDARAQLEEGAIVLEGLVSGDAVCDQWFESLRHDPFATSFHNPKNRTTKNRTKSNSKDTGWIRSKAKTQIVIKTPESEERHEKEMSRYVTERIGLGVSNTYDIGVYRQTGTQKTTDSECLVLEASVVEHGDSRTVRVTLMSGQEQVLWSRTTRFPTYLDFTSADALSELIFQSIEVVAHFAIKNLNQSSEKKTFEALIGSALDKLFSFESAQLLAAKSPLAQAIDIDPSGPALLWDGMLSTTLIVEQVAGTDFQALSEGAEYAVRRSIENNPWDEYVLGIAALINALNGEDLQATSSLAFSAMRISSGNAFAIMALAICNLRVDRVRQANSLAQRARLIASNSVHRHWWDMFCCLTEIATGQFAQAKISAQNAHKRAPLFKPPLRHLYALHLKADDRTAAAVTLEKLHLIEPQFSMDFLRTTPEYPAATLRNTGLIYLSDV